MAWALVILTLWSGQPFTVQIPVATQDLCEAARAKAADDVVLSQDDMVKGGLMKADDVPRAILTCLQVQDAP